LRLAAVARQRRAATAAMVATSGAADTTFRTSATAVTEAAAYARVVTQQVWQAPGPEKTRSSVAAASDYNTTAHHHSAAIDTHPPSTDNCKKKYTQTHTFERAMTAVQSKHAQTQVTFFPPLIRAQK